MKVIIYKELGTFKTTSEENYNRRIKDASLIQSWKDFETAEEIIEYCTKYCGRNKEDFIIA